ncbi:MAG: YcxB family protein [Lachnospiraceae bacterium]|nr:YcxB family protein [Lachnospiraceae bacterium]
MKVEFDVKMTTAKMYDYMLMHTLRSFSGIVGEAVGIMLIACFFASYKWLYLIAGVIVVFYLPVALYMNAKKQVMLNPVFKQILHYTLDEEGITIKVGEDSDSQKWSDMHKAISTAKSIIIYTNKINACIFPKSDMGDKLPDVVRMISTHMDPKKVTIKTLN